MLTRQWPQLFLCCAALWLAHPVVSFGAFPSERQSTLPCLVGQPAFSERLIAYNPWESGSIREPSDALLWNMIVTTKFPATADSFEALFSRGIQSCSTLNEYAHYTSTLLTAIGKSSVLTEAGIYFNRSAALYLSVFGGDFFNTCALVLGNKEAPLGLHLSVGRFPIHFGSNFSEHPLADSLESILGVTSVKPALSFNGGYRWTAAHQTKARTFGFIKQSIKAPKTRKGKEKEGVYEVGLSNGWGFHLQHEWNPSIDGIDRVNAGVSWVSRLPVDRFLSTDINKNISYENEGDGMDAYLHIDVGSLKIKIEGVTEEVRGKISERFKGLLRRKPIPPRSYAGHGEIAYRLPVKNPTIAAIGYTQGLETLGRLNKHFFGGINTQLRKNILCVVGLERKQVEAGWRHRGTLQLKLLV